MKASRLELPQGARLQGGVRIHMTPHRWTATCKGASDMAQSIRALYSDASRKFLERRFSAAAEDIVKAVKEIPAAHSRWSETTADAADAPTRELDQYRRKIAILLSSLFSVAWTSEGESFNLESTPTTPPALQPLAALSPKSSLLKSYQALRTAQIKLLSPLGSSSIQPSVLPPSVLSALVSAGKQLNQLSEAQDFFKAWYCSLDDKAKAYLKRTASSVPEAGLQYRQPPMTQLTDSRMLPQVPDDDEQLRQCNSFDRVLHMFCFSAATSSDAAENVLTWLDSLHVNAGGVLGDEKLQVSSPRSCSSGSQAYWPVRLMNIFRLQFYKTEVGQTVQRHKEAALHSETRRLELLEEMQAQNAHYRARAISSSASSSPAGKGPRVTSQGAYKSSGSSQSSRSASASSSRDASSLDSQTSSARPDNRIAVSNNEEEEEGGVDPHLSQRTPAAPEPMTGFAAFRKALSNFLNEHPPSPSCRSPPPTIRQVLRAQVDHWLSQSLGVNPFFFLSGAAILMLCFALIRARARRRVRDALAAVIAKVMMTVKMGTQARYL